MSGAPEVRLLLGDPMSDPGVVRELATRFNLFDTFVAGARRVDLHPIVLPWELHRAAVETAEETVRLLDVEIADRAFHDADERARYGFSRTVTRLAAASYGADDSASLVRVDLLLGRDLTWKVCEVNADCPGGHNEALALPSLARAKGCTAAIDPTRTVDALVTRLAELSRWSDGSQGSVALTYATAYAEDLQVCALLERRLAERKIPAVRAPPTAARRGDDGLLYVRGRPVSVLYRFFPTEYMHGQRNIDDIVAVIDAGLVRTMSSFAEMYLQSKLVMARAWSLRDSLRADDQALLARTVPETFDVADVPEAELLADPNGWVLKRALGRVGDDVFVGALMPSDSWRAFVRQIRTLREGGDRWVAQRFVPQATIQTPWGQQLLTLGAYVLDGVFAGYFARVTDQSHVSHDALCLPVFAEERSA